MHAFLRFITKYPIATALALVLLAFLGLFSYRHMPVDLFPDLEVPVINIITHYPGAAPEDMEMLVSRPIEDEMRAILGVKRVTSTSVQGRSQVTVEFTWGTTVRDARQLVQARMARLRSTLPAGVVPRLENIGTTLQEVSAYVFYGGGNPVTLRNTVRHDIAGRLMGVPGVSSVDVLGGERRAFWITLRPEVLARLHLSIPDVVATLKAHDVSTVAGFVQESGREYLVRGDARFKSISDIRSVPLVKEGERSVLLGMIAEIREGWAPRHYVVHGNGVPAVAILIRKQPGASTIEVVRNVDQALSRLKSLLPPGTSVKRFYDQSEIILESRHEILQNLVLGAGLAVLVLYFFLGSLRPTLIVAFTIPLTLLATLALMRLFGLGFNMITMTALALAVGMIVDDAIVVEENIFRHGKTVADPLAASIEGAAEIAGPDASGTFTTVAAFLPLVVVTGIAALFSKPFGLTISLALLGSLALSLTLVPLLFSRSKSVEAQREGFLGDRVLRALDSLLQSTLRGSFRRKWAPLTAAALLLGTAGLAAFLGKASVLPPIDEGALLIEYVMPPGTSLEESDRIGNRVERIALADPDVSCVYRRTGSPAIGYQVEGVNKGELLIKLKPKWERSRSAWEIADDLEKAYTKIPGCVFLYRQPTQEKIDESFSGLPALFGVTLYGPEMDRLSSLAGRVEEILSADPSISNVVNHTKVKASEIVVGLDDKALALQGLEPADVLMTLQAAYIGLEATRIIREKEDISVMIRLDTGEEPNIATIRNLPVATRHGATVPLESVANIRVRHTPATITRLNGQREVTLIAEVEGNIPRVVRRLEEKFERIRWPPGYRIEFSGQYRLLIETAKELLMVLAGAIVLIHLIMAMQFGSWLQPLVILVTIPLAGVGAVIALFVTGQGLDVSVGMGAVTLVGIAVNNAIVLIDEGNRRMRAGAAPEGALLSAASVRLRPILLTTFTTIAALLPTAIGTSVGSRIFQPFAMTMIGGLLSAMFATLVVVPTVACWVSRSSCKG
ncbi:MAG: efflux RND transporter permease subunit [Deltaproteobacteria bacterium]|nr:MAG: efflux RND transporter permease subunit [Deltaproteobacteria bacterium]